MPRFFFDLINGDRVERDRSGVPFATPSEARRSAMEFLAEVARDRSQMTRQSLTLRIRDEHGRELYECSLKTEARDLGHEKRGGSQSSSFVPQGK